MMKLGGYPSAKSQRNICERTLEGDWEIEGGWRWGREIRSQKEKYIHQLICQKIKKSEKKETKSKGGFEMVSVKCQQWQQVTSTMFALFKLIHCPRRKDD